MPDSTHFVQQMQLIVLVQHIFRRINSWVHWDMGWYIVSSLWSQHTTYVGHDNSCEYTYLLVNLLKNTGEMAILFSALH